MADNLIVTVLGRKGSGKTTLTREIITEFPRVVAFDWNGEYAPADGFEVAEGRAACISAVVRASGMKRYKLSLRKLTRADTFFVFGVVEKMKSALVVVEEASNYCSPSFLPDELASLVRYGRHNELSQLYVARRPAELNRDLTAQSDIIVTFQQQEPRDLAYLRACMGPEGDKARTLGQYEILAYGDMAKAPLAVTERLAKQDNKNSVDREETPDDSVG